MLLVVSLVLHLFSCSLFFSARLFFLMWKNVSHLIIPFSFLPLSLLLLLHLNSATKTHNSEQKMTVWLVFFHVFRNVMALVQQRAYFKSVKILLVCFKHFGYFTIAVLYVRKSERSVENEKKCRKYVEKETHVQKANARIHGTVV